MALLLCALHGTFNKQAWAGRAVSRLHFSSAHRCLPSLPCSDMPAYILGSVTLAEGPQIKDDLFDYSGDQIGKPVGIDIRERKVTLPLLHALGQAGWMERMQVIRWVRNAEDKPANVDKVIAFVRQSGGLAYAEAAMQRLAAQAREALAEFPASDHRQSLSLMIDYTINRKS